MITIPSDSVTFVGSVGNPQPLPCPTLSLSSGAMLTWTPTASAQIHAVTLDVTLNGGSVWRIACIATEDAGSLAVTASILGQFAGANSVVITFYDVAGFLLDAGDTPIAVWAETSIAYPYASQCTISP
jgi:hypothetical protein